MSEFRRAICAFSATVFAVLFLASVIVFGHPVARSVAIAVALLAVFSQFVAQDEAPGARMAHLVASYLGFVLAIVAFIAFVTEN